MKKKIIITALSVMLASTSIVPAYAAEPLPAVERSLYFTDAFEEWADKHVEECNKVTDLRERYRYIVRLVADNLNLYQTYLPTEEAVMKAYNEDRQVGVIDYVHVIVYLSNKCGLEAYPVEVYGNAIAADGRTNYMPCVYFDDTPYLTVIQNIEAGDSFDDYVLLPNGTYGVNMTGDPRAVEEPVSAEDLKFGKFIDPYIGTIVVYDSDGSAFSITYDMSIYNQFNATDKYYICENATLRPVSREDMLALGYVEQ